MTQNNPKIMPTKLSRLACELIELEQRRKESIAKLEFAQQQVVEYNEKFRLKAKAFLANANYDDIFVIDDKAVVVESDYAGNLNVKIKNVN